MVVIMATRTISLRTEALYPLLTPPALEGSRPSLNATDYLGAGDEGDFRVPHGLVPLGSRAAVVSDGRWLKYGLTA